MYTELNRGKILILSFTALLVIGSVVGYLGYAHTVYALDRANALFSRAETAGFVEGMMNYTKRGRELLPREGNPVWIFPTDKTDFRLIQSDLDSILARGDILATIPRNSDGYQQGVDDLRGKIKTLQDQVREAAPFLFASVVNLGLSALWIALQISIVVYLTRGRRPNDNDRQGANNRNTSFEYESEGISLSQQLLLYPR